LFLRKRFLSPFISVSAMSLGLFSPSHSGCHSKPYEKDGKTALIDIIPPLKRLYVSNDRHDLFK
jgi:hypothetical protein